MSRVGIQPIVVPKEVSVNIMDHQVVVKGKLGEIKNIFDLSMIRIRQEEQTIFVERTSEEKSVKSLHGLYRMLLYNMVTGVHSGFKKTLELVGVGYRASFTNGILELSLGYSHNICIQLPKEISCSVVAEKGQNIQIHLQSFDKVLLGVIASRLRALRKKDPYKGKGVLLAGEVVRRKAGKSAGKGKK